MTIPAPWCSCACLPGRQVKSGSSASATFMRNVPEPDLHADELGAQLRRNRTLRHEIAEQELGRHVGGNRARCDLLARVQHHAADLAIAHRKLRDTRAGADLNTRAQRPPPQSLGVIAPMPPIACPQAPRLPFTSPKQ